MAPRVGHHACYHAAYPQRASLRLDVPHAYWLPDPRAATLSEESKHATRVLRLKAGDGVELFDGDGGCLSAHIVAVDARGYAEVMPAGDVRRMPWQGPRWDMAVACTGMTQRADWAVEKCAELGLASLIPLLTERVDGRRQQRAEQSAEFQRWGRLSIAASKQCLRLHALKVAPPTPLSQLLPTVRSSLTLVALQGGPPVREVLAAHSSAASTGGLLIVGPPGDFTAEEKEQLLSAGALGCGLGDLRLRTETAAVALASCCVLY